MRVGRTDRITGTPKGSRSQIGSICLMSEPGLRAKIGGMQRIIDTLKKLAGPVQSAPTRTDVTIRRARPGDASALTALAQLDSSRPPRGSILVAEVDGELWAAASVEDGHVVADPFRPSGELAFSLLARARELGRTERRGIGSARRPAPAQA
jgi:hypothetical protein